VISPTELSLEDVRVEGLDLLDSLGVVDEGQGLDERSAALIGLAVRASVATLDVRGIRSFAARALDAGATAEQVHETLVLVSALGVHSLMVGSRELASLLRERADPAITAPIDERREALWLENVGSDPFWERMEQEVPGFLDALLRLSPEAFEAFFAYCSLPWRTAALPALTKELMSMATDATHSHRYLPGLRLHLANAVRLGAGRLAVLTALEIGAAAPPHRGVG
jgi:alkylhydroperoxidase/carboxymuconolactone decarboxylase family protein YurZ